LKLFTLWEPESDGAAATSSLLKTTLPQPLLKLKQELFSLGKDKLWKSIGT